MRLKNDGRFVLDAGALIEFVDGAAGAKRVREILGDTFHERAIAIMSVVHWGEVMYCIWERHGEEHARSTMANLSRLPIELVPVDLALVYKASELKVLHKIPFVDCMAAALAEIRDAFLVTSDRHFERLGRRVKMLWLPR